MGSARAQRLSAVWQVTPRWHFHFAEEKTEAPRCRARSSRLEEAQGARQRSPPPCTAPPLPCLLGKHGGRRGWAAGAPPSALNALGCSLLGPRGDGFPSWASEQHEAPGSLPQFALAR